MNNSILETESLVILLLLVISVVAVVIHRLRIPYTVALVLVGLLITFRQILKAEVTPELLLTLFIPPIAFEAAFRIEWRYLRDHLAYILGLAVIGVMVSTIIIGGSVTLMSPTIPLAAAVVFGALISATDPVAVVALFKASKIARPLTVLVESESLLNDGTAIVIFNLALLVALTGTFDPLDGVIDFVRVSAGGVAIGCLLGWGISQILVHIDDYLVETTLTTCLAFGSYVLAERLQTSGVLAVVAAGLFCGTLGTRGMSPTTKIVVSNFWEYLAFVANSMVFLLIGLSVNISQLTSNLGPIAVAVAAVLFSRAVVVYGQFVLLRRTRSALKLSWHHVIFWGGLRGAVSLALALSLPVSLADRSTLLAMTFGVVLFTLLIQATTMPVLLKRLGFLQISTRHMERDLRFGRLYAAQAAWRRLVDLHQDGVLTGDVWAGLQAQHDEERQRLDQEMRNLHRDFGDFEREMVVNARREALRAERAALVGALQRGLVSDEAYHRLIEEVDKRIDAISLIAQAQVPVGGERQSNGD